MRGLRLMLGLVAAAVLAVLALLALQNQAPLSFALGDDVHPKVPQPVVVGLAALAGALLGGLVVGRLRPAAVRGHDPRALLPRVLNRRVRRAIDRAYEVGSLDEALGLVQKEREREPYNLGLQYWSIRLELESGGTEAARTALVAILPRLPEAALTIRWSSLFEAAGEQDLWVRNVLDRIRAGLVVRRSTFRELVRLLEAAHRFEEGLEVLQRLREIDPPTPEEEGELIQTEMILRVRLAETMVEEARAEEALAQVQQVRERFSGWRAPYRVGFRCLLALEREDEAVDWVLEGFRNTGDPDLLLLAYERRRERQDPVQLLESWDDALDDLHDDGWYLLTSGWLALRHGLVEEGIGRLRRIPANDPAYAHAEIVQASLDGERGHARVAAQAFAEATWAWSVLPFVWRCAACGTLATHAEFICPSCGAWEAFAMLRPFASAEDAARPLVGAAVPVPSAGNG